MLLEKALLRSSPSRVIPSEAVICTPPACPAPKVLADICPPLVRESFVVSMTIPPLFTSALVITTLTMLLRLLLASPSRVIPSEAVICNAPASPEPKVPADIRPPLVRERVVVSMTIPLLLPTALRPTVLLSMELGRPLFRSPSRVIPSEAVICTAPACPVPWVIADICPPLVRSSFVVSMTIPPLLPTASVITPLKIQLLFPLLVSPSRVIPSEAVICTAPTSPCPEVMADICPPLVRSSFVVLMTIPPLLLTELPTPVEATVEKIPLDNSSDTSPISANPNPLMLMVSTTLILISPPLAVPSI